MNRKLIGYFLVACLVVGVVFELVPLSRADVAWANTNFVHRKAHLINSLVGADINYQVNFTVHYGLGADSAYDVYLNSMCRTDFADLRVYAYDGTLLSAWNQTQTNGDNVKVWTKISANLTSSSETIYLYYGNATALSYWNQTAVFIDVIGGVVGAWNMEEVNSVNPVLDYSGNKNNGTAVGTNIVVGKFLGKNARNFDGNDYIDIPDQSYLGFTNSFSILLYAQNLSYSSGGYAGVVWKGYPAVSGGEYSLGLTSSGGGYFFVRRNANNNYDYPSVPSTPNISSGNWQSIVLTAVASTSLNIYQNGSLTSTASISNTFYDGSNSIRIGINNYASNFIVTGTLSGIYIFSGVLSSINIASSIANYPDATLDLGKILFRKYIGSDGPTQGTWGNVENYVVPTPTPFIPTPSPTPDPDALTIDDAVGLAVVGLVFAIALPTVFLVMKRKKDE
jgi:hypothetical protein